MRKLEFISMKSKRVDAAEIARLVNCHVARFRNLSTLGSFSVRFCQEGRRRFLI